MPTYEYRCKPCGHEFEVVQSFHDDPLTECPTCGGEVRKVFGSVGITFKGSGFYRTDSRSGSSRPASTANGDGGASKESSSSDSGSSSSTAGSSSGDSSSSSVSAPA